MQKPRQHKLSGFYAYLEQSLLLTLVITLILAVQSTQRLRQLNRVPGVTDRFKGGASTGVTIRGTNTTGCRSAGRESRVVQRGDIQSIELGIIQDIRQRNLFGNRLSGSLSSRCRRRLADRRTIAQSLASHRLIRVNSRLLCGCLLRRSCYRLDRCLCGRLLSLSGLCGLRRHRLGGLCRLSGLCRRHTLSALRLNSLGLYGLARSNRSNRSLSHLRLCRSTRRSGGSSRTALLVKEHATAANRLETARTLLAALLTVTRGRLRRAGRTGRYGTSCVRRLSYYRCFCLSCFCLGCLFRRVHRNVRTARA